MYVNCDVILGHLLSQTYFPSKILLFIVVSEHITESKDFCDPVSFDKSAEYILTLSINGVLLVARHKYSFSGAKTKFRASRFEVDARILANLWAKMFYTLRRFPVWTWKIFITGTEIDNDDTCRKYERKSSFKYWLGAGFAKPTLLCFITLSTTFAKF